MTVFACVSGDFHPYECDGPGKCRHCDRREIQADYDPQGGGHDPRTCELCEEPIPIASGDDLSSLVSDLEDWEMSR